MSREEISFFIFCVIIPFLWTLSLLLAFPVELECQNETRSSPACENVLSEARAREKGDTG
mgnify:CR=1 FL=1